MANKKKKQTKKVRFKFRFYVICALFLILLVYLLTTGIGKLMNKGDAPAPSTVSTNDASTKEDSPALNATPEKDEKQNDAAQSSDKSASEDKKADETTASSKEAPDTSLTEIVVNFKDKDGKPIDMNITPNCFLTQVSQEWQWKKAVYQHLIDISTSGKESLFDTPTLTAYTGKNITIKMNTDTQQYFRFVFTPKGDYAGYNPDLHGELNIHFTTTPADNGMRVVYDAILDYSAEMIDDVFTLNLIEEGFMKDDK